MTEPRILESTIKPKAIEKLGNGTYYYNYDIKEKTVEVEDRETSEKHPETRWNFIQAYINGTPDYEDAVLAILRQYISADEEFAIINKYNGLKLGIGTDYAVCTEYEDYCKLVATIKAQVRKDFGISNKTDTATQEIIPDRAIYTLLKEVIKTVELTDSQALECKAFYPIWTDCVGKVLAAGDKVTYQGALYRVRQDIPAVLGEQVPGADTTDLYEEIQ